MIEEDVQRLALGEVVEMYQVDLTNLGDQVYYFTPTTEGQGDPIVFQGITYYPVDIMGEGFETSGRGVLPTPTIRVANTTRALASLVNSLGDLVGGKITRIRTLKKYLDDQPTADPTQHFPLDVYYIDQKTAQNKTLIEFKLSCLIDVEGIKLPRRRILRDYCSNTYRRYDGTKSDVNGKPFAYTNTTCPYRGAEMYDLQDKETQDPQKDKCAKHLSSCLARYGTKASLPFRGFPGAGRLT